MDFKVEITHNPRPPVTPHLYWVIGQEAGSLSAGLENHPLLEDEYIADHKFDPTWPWQLQIWHKAACGWVPPGILEWWLPYFDREPALQPMPLGWWLRRTLVLVVVRVGNAPVGVGALTIVIGDGRQGGKEWYRQEICYEIRGVVVSPEYRKKGIFKRTVGTLLKEASLLGHYPTFMVTYNEALRRVVLRQMVTRPFDPRHEYLKRLVCWDSPPFFPPCRECPMTAGTTLWWDTDKLRQPGELTLEYLDG